MKQLMFIAAAIAISAITSYGAPAPVTPPVTPPPTEAVAKYADMGKGVGIAVKESLQAMRTETVELSNSNLGKCTMFLIAWKVMGADIRSMFSSSIRTLIAGILLIVFVRAWKTFHGKFFFGYDKLKEVKPDKTKVYERVDSMVSTFQREFDGMGLVLSHLISYICLGVGIGILCGIAFGG